jgi:SsrA-binding protein
MKTNINIQNRKVKFEYQFIDTYIAGIQLIGTEIKSIKSGEVSLVDSFCVFNKKELFLKNLKITNIENRDIKLLLNKSELKKLSKDLVDGLTIIPYRLFVNDRGIAKIEIVLGKGKKIYDKRETIKKRDIDRDLKRND